VSPTDDNKAPGKTAGNTAVPQHGDHDRVQLLSLKADGTPDQNRPEMIDASEFTKEATREQFRQQAVSAADVQIRSASSVPMMSVDDGKGGTKLVPASEAPQDPSIQEAIDAHQKVADAATKAADAAVDALTTDDTKDAAKASDPKAS
jgi:hypothetical protein